MINLENIPVARNEDEHVALCHNIINAGGIPRDKLVKGARYRGVCRNSDEATWDGDQFIYTRWKWGSSYVEHISHFEDEMYYDVFVPLEMLS